MKPYKKTISAVAIIDNKPFEFEFNIESAKNDIEYNKIGGRAKYQTRFTTKWKSQTGSMESIDGKTRKESIANASRMEAIFRNPKAKSMGKVNFAIKK